MALRVEHCTREFCGGGSITTIMMITKCLWFCVVYRRINQYGQYDIPGGSGIVNTNKAKSARSGPGLISVVTCNTS